MNDTETQQQDGILIEEEFEVKEPPMYKVVLLNDDYTTMDFVVLVLEKIFNKTPSESQEIMLSVHKHGVGSAGVYTREIAETKIATVHQLAKANEYPLKCAMEPM